MGDISQRHLNILSHYIDVIMTTMASQITSLTVVYSTVYSDADERKHQSSTLLAFVWGIHRGRWIPRTKGQLRGKCFHLMTSSWAVLISDRSSKRTSCMLIPIGVMHLVSLPKIRWLRSTYAIKRKENILAVSTGRKRRNYNSHSVCLHLVFSTHLPSSL